MKLLFIYLLFLNVFSFAIMYTDKTSAIHRLWRIPEKTIFTVAIIGGSLGVYLGMKIFNHKVNKPTFYKGIPLIFIVQIVLFSLIYFSNISMIFEYLNLFSI